MRKWAIHRLVGLLNLQCNCNVVLRLEYAVQYCGIHDNDSIYSYLFPAVVLTSELNAKVTNNTTCDSIGCTVWGTYKPVPV